MYIDAPIIKVKSGGIFYRKVDGLTFSKNIEAAIWEKQAEGYEFVNMHPINSPRPDEKIMSVSITSGMILNFRK